MKEKIYKKTKDYFILHLYRNMYRDYNCECSVFFFLWYCKKNSFGAVP